MNSSLQGIFHSMVSIKPTNETALPRQAGKITNAEQTEMQGTAGLTDHDSVPNPQLIDKGQPPKSRLEAEVATRLAFHMIDQATQRDELRLAAGAMVILGLMRGAGEMLIEPTEQVEPFPTEVTAVEVAIPRRLCRNGGGALAVVAVPADLLIGEDVTAVDLAAILVDFRAVDAGFAVAGLEMMADAREVGVLVGAPGAFDVLADVHGGLEMLFGSR